MTFGTFGRVIRRTTVHLLSYLYGALAPVRLTPGERRFIDANRALWQEMTPDRGEEDGLLLVEPITHPVMLNTMASFAAITSGSRKLGLLFTLHSHADKRTKALLSSYTSARFVYVHSPRTLPMWIGAWWRALRVYRRLREPRDILLLSDGPYRYGDTIYDALLARGYATVSAIDVWTLVILQRHFYYQARITSIVREHDVRSYVSFHSYVGLLQGTFARTLMRRRMEVLSVIGSGQLILHRYRGPEGIGEYELRPEPRVLAALLDDRTGEATRHADRYIEERFGQATDDASANMAFDKRRRVYVDRAEFATDHGLDPRKPIVFVMLHAFNDYPHSHFRRAFMFQDYYDWFIKTLEHARTVTSVNWVFKEHPGADYYPTKDVDVRRIMSGVMEPHIRFLPRDADFNAASIRHIGHAILTCIGSAGLEFACVGIPPIVSSEGPYTGYGFTREPPGRDSYFRELSEIAGLERLTDGQIRVARLVTWYELGLAYDLPYLLAPSYQYWQVADFRKVDVWSDVAERLRTVDRSALRHQMDMIAEFLAAEDSVHLLDLEKYPFLRTANRAIVSAGAPA